MPAHSPPAPIGTGPSDELGALLALGKSARSWDFLERALPLVDRFRADSGSDAGRATGLSLLAASHLARLGLRSCAREILDKLPAPLREAVEVRSLAAGIGSLPDDSIVDCTSRRDTNIEALGERLNGLAAGALRDDASALQCFAASDGNVLMRRHGRWLNAIDGRGVANRTLAEHRSVWANSPHAALVLAGMRLPWLLKSASEARTREALGYRAPIYVIEPDIESFLGAMSVCDLSAELRDGHIRVFVGPDAVRAFGAFLDGRHGLRLSATIATESGTSPSLTSEIGAILAGAIREQEVIARGLEREVRAVYEARDTAWWRERFRTAGTKLRVLVPTTRYSTFLKHSSADIAGALRALGHDARVLIEPDDSSGFSEAGYLQAFREHEPDLVVCINCPRSRIGEFLPRSVPWVCWIQDQMPHLFDEQVGRGLGALDFTVGHVLPVLHEKYGYPRENSLVMAVPASETKFFVSEASESDRARFECEIAYVSHQSETPDAQHERIVSELRANPTVDGALVRAMPALRDAVRAHVQLPLSTLPFPAMSEVVRASLAESLGEPAPDHVVELITTGYAYPLADRLMRHETLAWAADAARRNNWRFHLYGKGWEKHPTLAEFAKGPLAHDGDLRRSYQLAGCHLQVTYHMLAHPRLCECVLSGGIPLCRFHWGERSMIETWLFKLGWHQGAEFRDDRVGEDVRRSPWTDAPALMRFASVMQSLGCFEDAVAPDDVGNCKGYTPGTLKAMRWGAPFHPRLVPDRSFPAKLSHPFAFQMVGEQPEFFFHDSTTLEDRVQALSQSRELRVIRNTIARKRIEDGHTYRAAADRILAFVRERLSSARPVSAQEPA